MGSATRVALALTSLLCLSGAIVLLFLLILAGSRDRNPLNRIFFLQADTSGIPDAPDGICHWTLYNFCAATSDGRNTDCRPKSAAYPFDPARNFGTHENIPTGFLRSPRKYFYLSRFLYSFYVIDLFFCLASLLLGLWALVGRYGGYSAAAVAGVAWFCTAFTAAIMTACFSMAQNEWRRAGRYARIGVKATAFTWTVFVLVGLAMVGFVMAAVKGRGGRRERERERGFRRLGGVRGGDREKGEEERRLREEVTT